MARTSLQDYNSSYEQTINKIIDAIEANQLIDDMKVLQYDTICIAIEVSNPVHFSSILYYLYQYTIPHRDYTRSLQRRRRTDEQIGSTDYILIQAHLYYMLYATQINQLLTAYFVPIKDPIWLNIALYISISRGDVAHVAEYLALIRYFNFDIFQYNLFTSQTLLESVENPLFRYNSYFYFPNDSLEEGGQIKVISHFNLPWNRENFDRNVLDETEMREPRIAIMKSLLDLGPLTVNVDESNLTQGHDITMNEYVNIDEYFREAESAFLFVQQISPTITFSRLISREELLKDIYNWDTRTRHCMAPDSEVSDRGDKPINVGLQPIIKIAHQQGRWCMYLKSLENVYNMYKSAIIYLKPACKTVWRVSERNARSNNDVFGIAQRVHVSIANYFSTEHCQQGVVEWIYALQVCGGDKCVQSNKLLANQRQSFNQLYTRNLDLLVSDLQQEYDSLRPPDAPSFEDLYATSIFDRDETDTETTSTFDESIIEIGNDETITDDDDDGDMLEDAMIEDILYLEEQMYIPQNQPTSISTLISDLRSVTNTQYTTNEEPSYYTNQTNNTNNDNGSSN